MYGWITIGHKKSYLSAIFVRKIHKGNWNEYEKGYHEYCLVLNQEKTKLISVDTYQNTNSGIEIHVLPVVTDLENWLPKNQYYGCMPFLMNLDPETLPATITLDLLNKCKEINQRYESSYQDIVEVKDKQDIQNLMGANSGFHDAHVMKVEKKDNQIHIDFAPTWGSKIDLWFEGAPKYCLYEDNDEYWWDSGSIFWEDGLIYLVDEYGIKSFKNLQNDDYSCYFAGEKMFYRVKPDIKA